jgi:superfamily II DNA or RNA helicase
MQLATGAGKTAIFSAMAASSRQRGNAVWICVPRGELLEQASESLSRLAVPHGRISAGHQESAAFGVHLVSSSTLIRRWDRIRTRPDFLVIDECHLHYDRQAEIIARFPETKILGVTASPERLDGRGLSDLYEVLVEGPDTRTLVEQGFLVPCRYYAPPLEGLDTVHRRGTEYDEAELAELLTRRKVYGSAIEHYRKHATNADGSGKAALVFTRSVAAAEDVAQRFSAAGYRFEPISGQTPTRQRAALVAGLRDGGLDGLVNCEVATYGLDVPRVECLILLRPTLSKALQVQMIGRGLRPHPGKRECVVLDHVGMLSEFGHPLQPHQWQFHGREKRKREPVQDVRLRLCPETFLYCERPSCVGCEHNTTQRKTRAEAVVDCQLTEVASPVPLRDRPLEERQEFVDRMNAAIAAASQALAAGNVSLAAGPIGDLLRLAKITGRKPQWVYHVLSEGRVTVNVPLLSEIARQAGYKAGWVFYQRREIGDRLARNRRRP